MKIVGITVWQMDLPLSVPYRLSGGRLLFERLDSTFVRVETDDGLFGWGEGCPWGHTYLPAHGAGLRSALTVLGPALLGQDPRVPQALGRLMDETLPGHNEAKSAIDMACWDILGQCAGLPLWKLLGGAEHQPVALNSSISTGTPDEMVALIRRASTAGYRTHSAKIGGSDADADIERIEAVLASLPRGEQVTFDVNRAWTPGVAVGVLNSVKSSAWIEQPCQTLDQCAHVAKRVSNPIMLDECLLDLQDHFDAWKTGACEGVKIKPNRLGGLTKARQARDFGLSVGWQMHIEDVGGSALADTAAIHLACSTPQENRLASWLCHAHLAVDPVPGQGARNVDGLAFPPDLPGLGVAPDPATLGEASMVFR